jgi:hypothetical protein
VTGNLLFNKVKAVPPARWLRLKLPAKAAHSDADRLGSHP